MKAEHKEVIHDYLNLDKRIRRTEKRLTRTRKEFEAKNYYGKTDFNLLGVHSKGFRVDNEVSNYVDNINICEHHLLKHKRRKYHFSRYLKTLDKHTYLSLKRRYNQRGRFEDIQTIGHDKKVLDEILEIEEALSYEFSDILHIELNKEYIEIEEVPFTADTLEQSFDKIIELLGV